MNKHISSLTTLSCLPVGLLVDVYGDYKYMFFMCGGVIVTGGLFLFVMNIYNYHMLEKGKPDADIEEKQKSTEDQDQVNAEVEMQLNLEAATDQSEPKG